VRTIGVGFIKNKKLYLVLFLTCLVEVIVLPRSRAIFFDGDAFFYFANHIQSASDFKEVITSVDKARQYRPLGEILFSFLFYPLFKLHYSLYSYAALFFHVVNTVLVFFILRRLLAGNIAVIAGTIFWGLNPVAIYVTHSFSFLADFTYAFFYFLSLLFYLKYLDSGRNSYATGVLIFLTLSLLSKEAAVTLPLLLLLITFVFFMQAEDRESKIQRARRILPLLFVLIGLYLLFYSFLKVGRLYDATNRQNYHFSFSTASILNKLDYILASLYLPFPDRMAQPDVDFNSERLVALASPLIFLLVTYLIWPFEHTNKNLRAGILWFLICASPVLFIDPSEFTHNLYVPLLGLALIIGCFFHDVTIFAKQIRILRPEFLYGYSILLMIASLYVNQNIFLQTNWRLYYEKIAKNIVHDMKLLHPTLHKNLTLYLLRSSEVQIPWIAYDGRLFNVFYDDDSIKSMFEEWEQPFPEKKAKKGQVLVLAYTDDHLYDITRNFLEEKFDPTAFHLFDEFNDGEISFINERQRPARPLDTPTGRPVFLAPVIRQNQLRHCVVTIAEGRIRFRIPELTDHSKLLVGVAKKFDLGNGAEGRIYFEYGDKRELIYSKFLDPASNPQDRRWFDEVIDLSRFKGLSGILTFECYPGPRKDEIADWFSWSKLKLQGASQLIRQ
jgi:hypothetical protein